MIAKIPKINFCEKQNLGQSNPIEIKLKLDMSCHLLNICTKFQIDISKHVQKSWTEGWTDVWMDGWMDGWTDRHSHGIMRPFFKRAYKNWGSLFDLKDSLQMMTDIYAKFCPFPEARCNTVLTSFF